MNSSRDLPLSEALQRRGYQARGTLREVDLLQK